MSNFEHYYNQLITGFESTRRDLLNMTINVIPKATEMHRRKWRVTQLDNTIVDLKTTIAACNHQIDEEKEKLEDLNSEYDRLQAQARKLAEDAKMLEGVTGIPAAMPKNAENELMKDIEGFAEHFRASFAEFYLNLPNIKQDLPSDPTLNRDANILVSSLRDYMTLTFNHRATDADLSKKIDEKTTEVKELDKKITEDENRVERELAAQRLRIEQSANRMKEAIQEQGRQLRKQGHKITLELQAAQDELKAKSGLDKEVRDFVMQSPDGDAFLSKLEDMLDFLIPRYMHEGRNQLVIAFGCTGGRHRSVTISEAVYGHLKGRGSYGIRIDHRDINRS